MRFGWSDFDSEEKVAVEFSVLLGVCVVLYTVYLRFICVVAA